ncbi:acyl carrier protein [Microbulbifer sp.]|uniref:acyl carrier protein n=1 Tax=Microbulbifer sp. TaxID=1908541 RepID=UPI003F2C742C
MAPDIDPDRVDPEMRIRDQHDFDSMYLLNFTIALGRALQLDIPEKDYPKLSSLDSAVDYLAAQLG